MTMRATILQSHAGPYVEMLVPRRKGQLLKLLILIPLTLLLFTSIYYQFYYDQPSSQSRQPYSGGGVSDPMSAPLIYERHNNNRNQKNLDDEDDQLDNSDNNNNQTIEFSVSEKINLSENNKQHITSHKRRILNEKTRLLLRDRLLLNKKQQRQISTLLENENLQSDKINSSDLNDNNDDDSSFSISDNNESLNKLKFKALDRRRLLKLANKERTTTTTSTIVNKINKKLNEEANNNDDNNNSRELQEQLEEEDAQDNAVIPAPNEPNGPGELGRPVILKNLTKEQQNLVNVGWENNAFNQYISDIISVNRTLPDVRDPSCKKLKYPNVKLLPQTSVIICFHNEAWSVLMRTVHSIINRSPKHLIKEIILVDDYSNKDYLGKQLEDYIKQLKIVKIIRAKKREGLIRARLLGAKEAIGNVLTFLDSHCECAEGWLEPLLSRIYEDKQAVVCPVIDVISDKTFEYHYKNDANSISVGGFDWNLQFNWHSVPDREKKRRKNSYEPLRSPTMAGGLFSIDKEFFERLGTYDSGFDIWGGENLELSFKTWMCGGKLEILPCSHVGHVFRSRSPYKWRTGVNVLRRNSVRLAEVWMDDYKKYYYDRIGHELGDFGDISERLELREKLNCKPFSYFVKEIYPELFIPGEALAYGEIRNEAYGKIKMCLDSSARKSDFHKPLGVYPCHGSGGNQYWLLSRDGEIRRDEACVDYAGHEVVLFPCHGSGGNQMWFYDKDTMQIRHSTSGRCMELSSDKIKLQMSDCDLSNDSQRWTFQHYNATLAALSSSSSTSSLSSIN